MLMTTVQMPGASAYDSQMAIHNSTANTDIILAREFKEHLSDPTWAHGLLDHGKERKCVSNQNWTDHEYHVQESKDVPHVSVKMLRKTTQLPALQFAVRMHNIMG